MTMTECVCEETEKLKLSPSGDTRVNSATEKNDRESPLSSQKGEK